MPSRLEDILLRSRETTGGIRHTLFCLLDDEISLLHLRSVSRALHDLISHHKLRIFRHLYVQSDSFDLDSRRGKTLKSIAQYCQHLTITVSDRGHTSAQPLSKSKYSRESQNMHAHGIESDNGSISPMMRSGWQEAKYQSTNLFSQLINLSWLTLRIRGSRDWTGFTELEGKLIDIRVAVESAELPNLRTLTLMPVHAMGILHLQWSMLHSFGRCSTCTSDVWQRLETLDLRIQKPVNLTEPQATMFNKQLYLYLDSFASTVRQLCLIWIDGNGPSPLALHLEAGLENRRPIIWVRLEELKLGNVTHLHRTLQLIPDLAPEVTTPMTLRDSHQGLLTADFNDSEAWVRITLDSRSSNADLVDDGEGSMRSVQSSERQDLSTSGVSSTSMLVPIVLDLG